MVGGVLLRMGVGSELLVRSGGEPGVVLSPLDFG